MGSTQSLIRKAEGLLRRYPGTRTGTALAQWCSDVGRLTATLPEGRLREVMVGGMNRTISRIRNCPECAALVEMLTKAWQLVIERVGAGRQGSSLYHAAGFPFAQPRVRMTLREEKECLDKQFASRLGLWGENMLFGEIDDSVDPPYASRSYASPDGQEFCFRELRHDADPFAQHVIWLLEVGLEGSRYVLYRRCNGIRDGAERTDLQRELTRLLGGEDEDHGSADWRAGIRRLRRALLEEADVPVAAAWTWLGLNQLACRSCALPGFEVVGEAESALRTRLSGPELWLPFAPNVEAALRRVTQEMKSAVETIPADDAQQARKQRCDRSKAAEFWKDWKLTWFSDRFKLVKGSVTVSTENLTDKQKRILSGLADPREKKACFDRRWLADTLLGERHPQVPTNCPPGFRDAAEDSDKARRLQDPKCRQANRTTISRLNKALRDLMTWKGFPDAPNPILNIREGTWQVQFTVDWDSVLRPPSERP